MRPAEGLIVYNTVCMQVKKKILVLINSLTAGGAENQILNMMNLLKDEFDFHVVSILANDEDFVKKHIDINRITIHRLGFSQKAYYFPLAFLKLSAIAKKVKPDLVHGVLFYGNILTRWLRYTGRYKVVNSIYDISEEPAFKLKLLKLTQKKVNTIFIDNNAGKKNYAEKGIAKAEQLVYTPNGIDFSGNTNFDEGLKESILKTAAVKPGEKLWVNVSRFAVQKDHHTLINAFELFVKEFPENKLLLVGDGSLVPEIQDLIKEKSLENNIYYLGRINDMFTLLTMCDYYVCSSAWEGMPIIVMQAMLYKLPVVSTAVGAIPDLIEENVTGCLCERRNPGSLCAAMKKMLSFREAVKAEVAEKAFVKIKTEFSLERLRENWLRNYNNALNSN